jgi:hypothetical protein
MLLGQVLNRLGEEAFAAETLIALHDLPLMVEVEATCKRFGEDCGAYAAGATRRFTTLASDDDWLALMTALERAPDPGAACLHHMLNWSLKRDRDDRRHDCGCGANNCTGE